jgi:uncharacterized repeat protein (TIGR03803 family)
MITECAEKPFHAYAASERYASRAGLNGLNPFCASATRMLATTLILVVAAATVAAAQTYTDLYNFGTHSGDPASPTYTGIIAQGPDGNLYSTAPYGGAHNDGAVFKITPMGTLTVLHSFDGTDGANPWGGLTLGTDGKFYGTTYSGGASGYGTIFSITAAGSLTTLYSFTSVGDGGSPIAPPIEGLDGNFYGVAGGPQEYSYGVAYKVTSSGAFTTLYSFDETHGSHPLAPLVQATNGYFYGTTYWGGTHNFGTVFRMSPWGELKVLFSFSQFDQNPVGPMIQGNDGALYGTTTEFANGGIVFRITDPGGLTVLHDFSAGTPYGGLVQATDGFFYGTTSPARYTGGPSIFRISSAGAFATLYAFESATGVDSVSTQVQHTNGLLYGDTNLGGTFGLGVFYSFDVGLGPFVTFVRDSGIVGAKAQILGQGFEGATAVSFNGTAASFNVESDTFMTAAVPAGATTGDLTVTESSGTLSSNKAFHVLPTTEGFVPNHGPVGTVVTISGTSLTQTTAVSFHGVPATSFTVVSDSEVQATVPDGATTGHIEIWTAGGTYITYNTFTVTP